MRFLPLFIATLAAGCAVNVDRIGPGSGGPGEGEGEEAPAAPQQGGVGAGQGGEADLPTEGEGEQAPVGEGEGEVAMGGEGEVEPPVPGEGEGEGEGEDPPDEPVPPGVALLRLTPVGADVGEVDLGATSVAAAFTVASIGDLALSGLALTLDGDGFSLESDCPVDGALAAGSVCIAQVTYTPEAPGPAAGVIVAQAGDLAASAVVRAFGLAPPLPGAADLVLLAGEGAYGETAEPVSREFTFMNRGESPTRELLSLVDGAAFTLADDGCSFAVVPPGATCTASVVFGPPVNGEFSGELLVWGDAPLRVPLTGRGVQVADAVLAVGSPIIEFGVAGPGDRLVRRLAVRNDGARPLERLRLRLAAPAAYALTDEGDCAVGQNLAGGASCEVAVAFEPDSEGLLRGELHVGAAGLDDLVVALIGLGDGFDPAVLTTDAPGGLLSFGDVEGAAERTVTVSNDGDAPSGALRVSLVGDGFQLGDPGGVDGALCPGAILGPGQVCEIPVSFEPARNGLHDGLLVIADRGAEARVTLTGRGAGRGAAELDTDPPAVDFGVVDSGDAADAVTIDLLNVGDLPGPGLRVRVIGPHAADFELSRDDGAAPCPSDGEALPGDARCSVTVAFRPRAQGERIAELEVSAEGVDPAVTTLTGEGRGFEPADLSWRAAPDPDFGDVHDVEPRDFWVQNLGGRISGQLSIRLTGDAEFRIDPGDDDCGGRTLPPLAECAVTVTFVTADNGQYAGLLEVSDRDQSRTIDLAAQSVGWLPADLQVDLDTLSFGDLDGVDISDELTATVTNEGELPVADIEVTLTDQEGVFRLVDDNLDPPACLDGADLLGGESCTITALLDPPDGDDIGSWHGTVTVGRGDHTVDIGLSGRRGVATNCQEIYDGDPDAPDGVYTIDPDLDGGQAPFDAYCVMSVAGGGWTVNAYLKTQNHWTWDLYVNAGNVGDVAGGFTQGVTLRDAGFPVTEKVIIYRRLIELGNDLGTHWMKIRRTDGQPFSYASIKDTNQGWTYEDSRGAGPVDAGNVCTHGCNTYAGHGMFHDNGGIGWHGTQSGNNGCRDGNNICWQTQGQGCNVGAGRCAHLTGEDEGVIYGVR